MEKESRLGVSLVANKLHTLENFIREKRMEKDVSIGKMDLIMRETLLMDTLMDLGDTISLT
jgi:hypothetical protein